MRLQVNEVLGPGLRVEIIVNYMKVEYLTKLDKERRRRSRLEGQ